LNGFPEVGTGALAAIPHFAPQNRLSTPCSILATKPATPTLANPQKSRPIPINTRVIVIAGLRGLAELHR
jgi:hypothetical protein